MKYILIFILLFPLTLLGDKETIIWLQNHRPPWMINKGEYKNQGYGDKIREAIQLSFPEYNHKTKPINFARVSSEMKKDLLHCYVPIGQFPAWEEFFHYSENNLYALGDRRILIRKETYEKLGSPKELLLEDLLKDLTLNHGLIANSPVNPKVVDKYIHQKNIFTLSSLSPSLHLMKMMEKGRVDWIVDFPILIKWAEYSQRNKSSIISVRIKNNPTPPVTKATLACSKTKAGKKIIDKFDTAIASKNLVLKSRNLVRKWVPNDGSIEEFDRINKKYFGY